MQVWQYANTCFMVLKYLPKIEWRLSKDKMRNRIYICRDWDEDLADVNKGYAVVFVLSLVRCSSRYFHPACGIYHRYYRGSSKKCDLVLLNYLAPLLMILHQRLAK